MQHTFLYCGPWRWKCNKRVDHVSIVVIWLNIVNLYAILYRFQSLCELVMRDWKTFGCKWMLGGNLGCLMEIFLLVSFTFLGLDCLYILIYKLLRSLGIRLFRCNITGYDWERDKYLVNQGCRLKTITFVVCGWNWKMFCFARGLTFCLRVMGQMKRTLKTDWHESKIFLLPT